MVLNLNRNQRKNRMKRPTYMNAYQSGRNAGFQRGLEDGYQQGHNVATTMREPSPPEVRVDVLVITAGMIPSLDIGIIQPFEQFQNRGQFNYAVRTEGDVSKELISQAHTILFVRNVEPSAYVYLEWAHELGKRTVYVIDDHFLDIDAATSLGQYYSDPTRRETYIKFLQNARVVKVDSPVFGNYLRERYNSNVVYFPGSVDFDWLDQQPTSIVGDGQVVIGYEGGSKEEDFAVVVPALQKVIDYYEGFVRVEFLGFVPEALAHHPSVIFEPCNLEYRDFIRKLKSSHWDIGLAPLREHPFNNMKTNNKFREYSACRIAGIYSDSPVYQSWVTHGETGYLVPHTTKGWFEGLKVMIENPALQQRIKDLAELSARSEFSLSLCMDNWNKYIFNT